MLRYSADLRTIAFVFTYYALIAITMTVALPTWSYFPLMAVICFLSFFCAVITHNTVHVPIFRSRVMNQIFQVLLTPTYGHPVSMFVPGTTSRITNTCRRRRTACAPTRCASAGTF